MAQLIFDKFEAQFDKAKVLDVESSFITLDKDYILSQGNTIPKYTVAVQLPKDIYAQLKKMTFKHPDTGETVKLTCLKAVDRTIKDEDGEVVTDDMGDPVKEFSHYQITAGTRVGRELKGKEVTPSDFVTMPDRTRWNGQRIGFGSKVSMIISLYFTKYNGKGMVGINIDKVFVKELVEVSGGGSFNDNDEWADLMGCDPSEVGLEETATDTENSTSKNEDDEDPFA